MNVLLTGAYQYSDDNINVIESLGYKVFHMQDERGELPCNPEVIDVTVCNGLFLYTSINQFEKLKYVQLTSVGYDRIPMRYIENRGILVRNARGVYSAPMAEFAICGVLQLYKKSLQFNDNQKNCRWEKYRDLRELTGKTVCIIGCGNIGVECAKRFRSFECRVVGVDLVPSANNYFETIYGIDDLNHVLSLSDVIILCLPLTQETKWMFNRERFEYFKSDSVLVNIARGELINTDALIDALKNKLFGAVLDVFDEEPLRPDDPLWENNNIIISPHVSYIGEGNSNRLWKVIISNLEKFMECESGRNL